VRKTNRVNILDAQINHKSIGFDAFITGYVYLHMLHVLGGNAFNRASMVAFMPYMNKVNLSMTRAPLDLQPVNTKNEI